MVCPLTEDAIVNKHLVKEARYSQFKKEIPKVVVQPFGATEPHNLHLPYGTDIYQVEHVADRAAVLANKKGGRVAVLPCIPFGVQTNQSQNFPLSINLNPTTLLKIVTDIAESLSFHSIRNLVLLNGHGGNDFYWIARELYNKFDIFMVTIHWADVPGEYYQQLFTHDAGDHANEMETSCMLHLAPELVKMAAADAGKMRKFRFAALEEGWARTPRPWHIYTTNSGAGNPSESTAEKGKKYLDRSVRGLSQFLLELSKTKRDAQFPFK